MKYQHLVIGLGEVGSALAKVLSSKGDHVYGKDLDKICKYANGKEYRVKSIPKTYSHIHIAFPYQSNFVESVKTYLARYKYAFVIIHSTVPIGTTSQIPGAVHSPVNGRHENMCFALSNYPKWFGGRNAHDASKPFLDLGLNIIFKDAPETTEALKLLCLSKYAINLAFTDYAKDVIEKAGRGSYEDVVQWETMYNQWARRMGKHEMQRPIYTPPNGQIGGHCVLPAAKMLYATNPRAFFQDIFPYEKSRKNVTIWPPSNIYPDSQIGENVSIGAFTEIGKKVKIGNNVRIGAFCFIPEGVIIEDNAWIGPRVTFGNDKYPPSKREKWAKTFVRKFAIIGAAVTVLPGIEIGSHALVGMGSVVTKDVPEYAICAGNPAKILRFRNGENRQAVPSGDKPCRTKSTKTPDL